MNIENSVERQGAVELSALIGKAEPADMGGAARFIASALGAARASHSAHRSRILSDLADMLGCAEGQLDFLFDADRAPANGHVNDRDPLIMPDYRAALYKQTTPLAAE